MSVQTTARTVFAGILGSMSEASVAVIYKGVEVSGFRDTETQLSGVAAMGDVGMTGARVFVSAETISKPERGDPLMVDGAAVFVSSVKTDPVVALYEIEYQAQQPIGD